MRVCFFIASQVCCKDLWYLEVSKPSQPSRVQLVRGSTDSLEVSWSGTSSAQYYVLQIQKYEMPPATTASFPTAQNTQPTTTTPAVAAPMTSASSPAQPIARTQQPVKVY